MVRSTSQQMRGLKHKLQEQRKALLQGAQQEVSRWGRHPIGELAGEVPDVGDQSVATMVTDLDHAIVRRHVEAIGDIDAALSRITKHVYGCCIDCGADIEPARLAAYPAAMRCIDCQSLHERTYAHQAMPTL